MVAHDKHAVVALQRFARAGYKSDAKESGPRSGLPLGSVAVRRATRRNCVGDFGVRQSDLYLRRSLAVRLCPRAKVQSPRVGRQRARVGSICAIMVAGMVDY